jgi:hypothetical protein
MEKQFVNGLRAFKPHEKAPDFIISDLAGDRDQLIEWLKKQEPTFKFQIKRSKDGKYYAELNTWKKDEAPQEELPAVDNIPF